jgi:hypothetical protein
VRVISDHGVETEDGHREQGHGDPGIQPVEVALTLCPRPPQCGQEVRVQDRHQVQQEFKVHTLGQEEEALDLEQKKCTIAYPIAASSSVPSFATGTKNSDDAISVSVYELMFELRKEYIRSKV